MRSNATRRTSRYFLSCGSWSVLGVLRDEPLMSREAYQLGLTNEARADDGLRPLFNITGLWILQECQREWRATGGVHDIVELVGRARAAEPLGYLINPDEPQFAQPGGMVGRDHRRAARPGLPASARSTRARWSASSSSRSRPGTPGASPTCPP